MQNQQALRWNDREGKMLTLIHQLQVLKNLYNNCNYLYIYIYIYKYILNSVIYILSKNFSGGFKVIGSELETK